MFSPKKLLAIGTIIFFSGVVHGQSSKFTAPAWADTIKNPLKENSAAAVDGKALYTTYCVACHGNKGKGDGPAAAGLSKLPADHTSSIVQKQTDGALFWMISNGNTPMPAYSQSLSKTQIWELVNYIRSLSKQSKK